MPTITWRKLLITVCCTVNIMIFWSWWTFCGLNVWCYAYSFKLQKPCFLVWWYGWHLHDFNIVNWLLYVLNIQNTIFLKAVIHLLFAQIPGNMLPSVCLLEFKKQGSRTKSLQHTGLSNYIEQVVRSFVTHYIRQATGWTDRQTTSVFD